MAIAAFLNYNVLPPEEVIANPEIMRKREFYPFEKDLTDNRLDALRRVRPDIHQSRSPDHPPVKNAWHGFIKRLICPFDFK